MATKTKEKSSSNHKRDLFVAKTEARYVEVNGKKYGYRVWKANNLPPNPPAILFLHGSGESGSDNLAQLKVGIGPDIEENPEKYPFLIIFPQKQDQKLWPSHLDLLHAILEDVEKRDAPDLKRRYLTGISQGGHGTFNCLNDLGWKFAAIAPICGWGAPFGVAEQIKDTPCWIFHGSFDKVVPASCSQVIFDCTNTDFEKPLPNLKLTIYFGVGHACWEYAYKEGLGDWFLNHKLNVGKVKCNMKPANIKKGKAME